MPVGGWHAAPVTYASRTAGVRSGGVVALFFGSLEEPSVRHRTPIDVLIARTAARSIACQLIGVLVFAQLALAAYACPAMPAGTANAPMGQGDMAGATQTHFDVMPAAPVRMDEAQPNLCAAHCQSGQQNVDVKPTPSPAVALLAGYFAVEPVAQRGGQMRPFTWAAHPPPLADPPHAILHRCFRI